VRHHLILLVAAKLLIPPILLFALYVQFHGDYGPGGGFQAGVIFASAFILYGLVFGLGELRRVAPLSIVTRLMAAGWVLYIGVGYAGVAAGGMFLDYGILSSDPIAGQHTGIFLIELGVGMTVASTMLAIYQCFAAHQSRELADDEW
jgi:multicomponent Na+:H+ antiporter subunit B